MNSSWQFWEKGVDDEVIKKILEVTSKLQLFDAQVGSKNNLDAKADSETRRSKTAFLNPTDPEHNDIFNLLTNFFYQANVSAFGVNLSRLNDIQYTEYLSEDEGFYTMHQDCFLESEKLSDRKLSLTMQLSDSNEYEGGDFIFDTAFVSTKPDRRLLKKKGAVLVFPSFMTHKVEPVTKGKRKSLVAWIDGPCWR